MIAPRELVHEGLGTTKALNYSLKRWAALSCYLDDGAVPIDNNHIEQQIRPWALGRKNGLFAGSLRSAKRAAALMSLILSAKLNGHDVYAYLKDVLTRLPTQRTSELGDLSCRTHAVIPRKPFQLSRTYPSALFGADLPHNVPAPIRHCLDTSRTHSCIPGVVP